MSEPAVGYILTTQEATPDAKAAMETIANMLEQLVKVFADPLDPGYGLNRVIHQDIDEMIAYERLRGMPDNFSRTEGLRLFRITIEEVP